MAVTVLIVDDDERFRDLARRMLTSWGYQVDREAGSVADALAQVAQSQPDLALVDVDLPDGDGLELTRRLTGSPWRVRVVLVSSDTDAASSREAAAAGAVAFVPKSELSSAVLHAVIDDDRPR